MKISHYWDEIKDGHKYKDLSTNISGRQKLETPNFSKLCHYIPFIRIPFWGKNVPIALFHFSNFAAEYVCFLSNLTGFLRFFILISSLDQPLKHNPISCFALLAVSSLFFHLLS